MYKIILEPNALRSYKKLYYADRAHFDRIVHTLEFLKNDPFCGKPLKQNLKGQFSLRVGFYRIIYTVDHGKVIIFVLDIGHRKEIYKN